MSKTIYPLANAATTVVQTPIKDVINKSNQGVILINQKNIQEIFTKSGDLAKANEFQTHYWALTYRFQAEDNSILDVCIPTVYFNYKQQVSGAHIDFELQDVKDTSRVIEPIHNMMVNKLAEYDLQTKLESILGTTVEAYHSNFHSIHKHPGGSSSQAFSGTDLAKAAEEPGVVYPLATASLTPNFAGIMAIDSGVCRVAHYEYRLATGTLGTDLKYSKGRCAAIITAPDSHVSTVERMVGVTSIPQSYTKLDSCKSNPLFDSLGALATDLYLIHGFSAFTDAVSSTNVEEVKVVYNNYNNYKYNPDSELKAYRHTYTTEPELRKLSMYKLNEVYKGMSYQNDGQRVYLWIPTVDKCVSTILELQKTMGYAAENLYGPEGFPIKSLTELDALYFQDLRKEYKALVNYLEPTTELKDLNSLTKKQILNKIEKLYIKYNLLDDDDKLTEEDIIKATISAKDNYDDYFDYY